MFVFVLHERLVSQCPRYLLPVIDRFQQDQNTQLLEVKLFPSAEDSEEDIFIIFKRTCLSFMPFESHPPYPTRIIRESAKVALLTLKLVVHWLRVGAVIAEFDMGCYRCYGLGASARNS